RVEHRGAAAAQGRQGLAVAPGDVEQRHHDQGPEVAADIPGDVDHAERGLDVREHVLVGVHGTLGKAGRAAGVEDGGDVVAAGALPDVGPAVGQRAARLELQRAAGVADDVADLVGRQARGYRDQERPGPQVAVRGE